ncbi:AAA family ATPase [Acidicapsa acidisoli]|uniref:AAA family ATPase n=1 Tax=Acidicapsa acidisoli TaxID=1615681 RepID=UPI0021E0182D|nr:AAA family ATPase [Acidicapsa acidisoli]
MSTPTQDPDALGANVLTIALIGPDQQRRGAVAIALTGLQAGVTREFSAYPELDEVPRMLEDSYDVMIVDLDSNPEYALDLVETICSTGSPTVMVYSAHTDSELLVRCMRAGAREFLTQPFSTGTIAEAMVRASVRRPTARPPKKTAGRLFVFLGAKGGSGVTTLACNFAVSLAAESGQNTLLIDLHLPLGDAALDLGITAQYSTVNALQNASRLDSNFLSRLLTKHSSGLSVLAAPGKFTPMQTNPEEVDKLLTIARQDFDYVVVDAGTRLDLADTTLFDQASTIYLITQVSIPELRNSNRLVSEFFTKTSSKLEIVLNRFTPRSLGVDEEHITKALTRPATWRVPNDYATARRTQNTATPLSLEDSPISRVIRQMARAASGLPANTEKKKRFGLFR